MSHEDEEFLQTQLITYLGNKRKLLDFIREGLIRVQRRVGLRKMTCYDAFAGSGVISRLLKGYSSVLYSNDLEAYATVIGHCYLSNRTEVEKLGIESIYHELLHTIESRSLPGLISELYAPLDDSRICPGERVFYTRRNAEYLDTARQAIEQLPEPIRPYFLAPLLYEASVHTNTGGVFKGFYKDAAGVGQFGGQGRHALERIMADIELPLPVFSRFECEYHIMQGDAAENSRRLPELDLAYLDPPYNQHPYGSNYFMLNLITEYTHPGKLSPVSGIPLSWNRSAYNKKAAVGKALQELLNTLPSRYAMLSYNSEGLLSYEEILDIARESWQHIQTLERSYPAYRAARNLSSRALHVKEYLFIMEHK